MSYQDFIIAGIVALFVGGLIMHWLISLGKKIKVSFMFYQLTPKLLQKHKVQNKK